MLNEQRHTSLEWAREELNADFNPNDHFFEAHEIREPKRETLPILHIKQIQDFDATIYTLAQRIPRKKPINEFHKLDIVQMSFYLNNAFKEPRERIPME